MDKNEKILIIGSGHWQVSGIKKLVTDGYKKLYVVDTRISCLKKISKIKKIHLQSLKLKNILSLVKRFKIQNCLSFSSEFTLLLMNQVKKELKKNYLDQVIINKVLKKSNFRLFQKANGFNHPNFFHKYSKIVNYKNYKNYFLKPNMNSDSRGIIKLTKKLKFENYKTLINKVKKNSFDKKIILEKMIDGKEYGGNCYFSENKIYYLSITNKIIKNNVVVGHIFPSNLNFRTKKQIENELNSLLKSLKIKNSIINFDLKIHNSKIYFLELSPRNGGNGLTEIIKLKSSIDFEKMFYKKKQFIKSVDNFYYCSFIIRAQKSGKIKFLKKNKTKNFVKKLIFFKKKGDYVKASSEEVSQIGMVIFKIKKINQYKKKINQINKSFDLIIENVSKNEIN